MRLALLVALLAIPAATAAIVPAACASGAPLPCLAYERIAHGLQGAPWGTQAIQTPEECAASSYAYACGDVDLATHWVAAAAVHRNNCCAELWIRDVVFDGATYVVRYDIAPFGVLQAFSEPHDVVAIERQTDGPVVAIFVGPPQSDVPHGT